jgi:MOSC domain-containing protein YiiM
VTQPRIPCFKLGIKMGRDEFVTEFLERRLLGFYLAVAREGEVTAGDPIVELQRDPRGFRVSEVAPLHQRPRQHRAHASYGRPRRALEKLARLLPQAGSTLEQREPTSGGGPASAGEVEVPSVRRQ